MTETINGLLTTKPTSPKPTEGEIKSFTWQQRTSQKTGKPWIKIKIESEEYGGKPCKIISARQTDFVDAHGNLSFALEIEPVNGAPAHQERPVVAGTVLPYGSPPPNQYQAGMVRQSGVEASTMSKDDYWRRKEDRDVHTQRCILREHSQAMSLEVLKLKATLNELTVEDLTPGKLTALANYFDADVLNASQNNE